MCVFFKDFVYLLFEMERERVCVWLLGEGRQGGVEREREADSMLSTQPNVGLNSTTLRSQSERESRVRCLTD